MSVASVDEQQTYPSTLFETYKNDETIARISNHFKNKFEINTYEQKIFDLQKFKSKKGIIFDYIKVTRENKEPFIYKGIIADKYYKTINQFFYSEHIDYPILQSFGTDLKLILTKLIIQAEFCFKCSLCNHHVSEPQNPHDENVCINCSINKMRVKYSDDKFECYICDEIVLCVNEQKNYCKNKHSDRMCTQCYEKIDNCPSCREKLSKQIIGFSGDVFQFRNN
jgi:hypothetical protein